MCTSGALPIFRRNEQQDTDTQAPPPPESSGPGLRRHGDQPGRRPDRSGDRPPDPRPVRARVPRGSRRDERLRGEQGSDPPRKWIWVPHRLGGPSYVTPARLRVAMAAASNAQSGHRPLARLAARRNQSASPRSIAATSSAPASSVRATPSRSTFSTTSVGQCRFGIEPSWTLIVSARPPAAWIGLLS